MNDLFKSVNEFDFGYRKTHRHEREDLTNNVSEFDASRCMRPMVAAKLL